VGKDIDYDSPRRPAVEVDDDSLVDVGGRGSAAKPLDVDEADAAETYVLPGAGPADEELTGAVIPMQADEFRCGRCFLVHHRSQLATAEDGQDVCLECSGA
jgi:hypothetical protein